jgi:ubiquinone/menaquinone biosynthesis C-methylase UbiE
VKLPRFLSGGAPLLGPAPPPLSPELRRQIRQSFDDASSDEEHFPSTIDPRIRHVQVLLEYFGLSGNERVLDVGCGKGRYGRILLDRHPAIRMTGLDISERMLSYAPPAMAKVSAAMTELPFGPSVFDAVYATESLEHAVDIECAITGMCQVLRPGGKLAIIDKNVEHWGKLKTPAWERWFNRRELEKLLARHCSSVRSEPISYWDDVAPDGLFLIWFARK